MFEGKLYKSTKELTVPDVAKRVRTDIRRRMTQGLLHPGLTYSVTSDAGSIHILVKRRTDAWIYTGTGADRKLSTDAERLREKLTEIANAYNYDKSDSQSDYFEYRFVLSVGFQTEAQAAEEDTEKLRRKIEKLIKDAEASKRLTLRPGPGGHIVYLEDQRRGQVGLNHFNHEDAPWHAQRDGDTEVKWFRLRHEALYHVTGKRETPRDDATKAPSAGSEPAATTPKIIFSGGSEAAPVPTPQPTSEAPPVPVLPEAPDESTKPIIVSHSPHWGLTVRNTQFTDGSRNVLKDHDFKWSRGGQLWYIPKSKNTEPDRARIDATASALRALGLVVQVIIGDEPEPAATPEPNPPAGTTVPAVQSVADPARPTHLGAGNRILQAKASTAIASASKVPTSLDEPAPGSWRAEHFTAGDAVSNAGQWVRVHGVSPDRLVVMDEMTNHMFEIGFDVIRGHLRDGIVALCPPSPEPSEPLANVFMVSAGRNPTKARCLYRVTVSDAKKICSDPRTAGSRSSLHYSTETIDDTDMYSWGHDDGRYSDLLTELGVTLLSAPVT